MFHNSTRNSYLYMYILIWLMDKSIGHMMISIITWLSFSLHMIGLKLVIRFWVLVISPSRLRLILTGVRKVKSPSQAFVFRLSHKQILKMTMKLLIYNNKTLSWNKTIIDFRIGCYLVYQPLNTYIHLPCSSVNITFFQIDKSR